MFKDNMYRYGGKRKKGNKIKRIIEKVIRDFKLIIFK